MYLSGVRPGRLLDVGCGEGEFLDRTCRAGWQVVGVDFDPKAVRAAGESDVVVRGRAPQARRFKLTGLQHRELFPLRADGEIGEELVVAARAPVGRGPDS